MASQKPVLLLEINEIPWRFLDRYLADGRFPGLKRFFDRADTRTTIAADGDVLRPWSTWSSFHRGMTEAEHEVHYLGQDPATFKGKPIWDHFREKGLSVGICGSMQTWPPRDPGPDGFWIPDTFARDPRCIPQWVEPLQAFNLAIVGENGRTFSDGTGPVSAILGVARALPRLGIRARTLAALASQLVAERVDRQRVVRRPVFQGVLFWDLFLRLYRPEAPPAFATFFTNHVASLMHRYWNNVFPEDFAERGPDAPCPHRPALDFAMSVVDEICGTALSWVERNPDLRVVFATSMGQHAVRYDHLEGYEIAVRDLGLLLETVGAARDSWTPARAMVPQVAFGMEDATLRRKVIGALNGARTRSGRELFTAREAGSSVSLTIHVPPLADIRDGKVTIGSVRSDHPQELSFDAVGVEAFEVEPGSGYHMSEGILATVGSDIRPDPSRTAMPLASAKGHLLELAGLD